MDRELRVIFKGKAIPVGGGVLHELCFGGICPWGNRRDVQGIEGWEQQHGNVCDNR